MKKIKVVVKCFLFCTLLSLVISMISSNHVQFIDSNIKMANASANFIKLGKLDYSEHIKLMNKTSISSSLSSKNNNTENNKNTEKSPERQTPIVNSPQAASSKAVSSTQEISLQTLKSIKINYTEDDIKDSQNKQDFANRNNILSQTNYLIWVNKASYSVNIFEKTNNYWTLINQFSCSIGASGTPTIEGIFQTVGKLSYFVEGSIRCKYATRIFQGYMFHTILYNKNGIGIFDDRIGIEISHGCIRLAPENAKYIYENIPVKTTVYIN
jgi:lipoprotein-anchoring transpeptidase ErfK/SrfK